MSSKKKGQKKAENLVLKKGEGKEIAELEARCATVCGSVYTGLGRVIVQRKSIGWLQAYALAILVGVYPFSVDLFNR